MMGLALLLVIASVLLAVAMVTGLLYALRHPPRKTYAVALGRGQPTEPEAVGLAGEARTLALADGAKTQAWVVRGEDVAGPTVVVLHGFGDSRYGALTWAGLLAPYAARVVVFDQRGQGESQAKASTLGTREVEDALAVIDQLVSPLQAEAQPSAPPRVVLFGYSMGAVVAIGAAARGDERIAGVIADGPYRYWHAPVRAELRRRRYPVEPVLSLARAALWLTDPAIRRFDRVEHARQVRCPLLVLHGTDDAVCELEAGRAIAEAAERGELVVFEGGGHMDLAEREPERYREALREFFERVKQ